VVLPTLLTRRIIRDPLFFFERNTRERAEKPRERETAPPFKQDDAMKLVAALLVVAVAVQVR
jgi:hypothetical protein